MLTKKKKKEEAYIRTTKRIKILGIKKNYYSVELTPMIGATLKMLSVYFQITR